MSRVHRPAVAGMFYPANPSVLAAEVDSLLADAPDPGFVAPVVMAPHAGYIYSGSTAAEAYRALDPKTKRVVVLGPTHRVPVRGMALVGADAVRTPLGDIPVDAEITEALEVLPEVGTLPQAHAQEHSIEVHLPFMQRYLEEPFTVVPIAVGHANHEAVAQVIETALSFPNTSVIISSDLSHYLPYQVAQLEDQETLEQVLDGEPLLEGGQACGMFPLNGMMTYANRTGMAPVLLSALNSGDTAGDKDRVVGYAAVAWQEPEVNTDLPTIAKHAIAQALLPEGASLSEPDVSEATLSQLSEPGATFVTLEIDGQLRGCIGSLQAYRSLGEDLIENAKAAAFEDPRFQPLTPAEFDKVSVEVSVLSEPKPLFDRATTEDEVLEALVPGRDGVILSWGPRRATFLPQVWDSLPNERDFLAALKQKAGLPRGYWDPQVRISTYQVSSSELPASPTP